jgi:hypothetical protein
MPESPTKQYSDKHGYAYVETADWWKEACASLPSFAEVWWPDYSTKVVEDVIDGQPVVIQLWKGWCQKFLGQNDFPGGIGAEVGVYRRMPGRVPPETLPGFPPKLSDFILGGLSRVGGDHLWWAYPELKTKVDFEIVNPKTNQTFFTAGPEKTYWMNKWMDPTSYEKYKADQGGNVPLFSAEYVLKYRINGKTYPQW